MLGPAPMMIASPDGGILEVWYSMERDIGEFYLPH